MYVGRNGYENETSENVIFIHGFLSSSSFWAQTVFPQATRPNLKLFTVDLLGFGHSPKPADCLYQLKDHISMIEKSVIEPYQLESFHLVAHSMGCMIALDLAARYPNRVKSITLLAPVSTIFISLVDLFGCYTILPGTYQDDLSTSAIFNHKINNVFKSLNH